MEVSTPEGPDSLTVNLVGARRKGRTSLFCRLHIYIFIFNKLQKQTATTR